MTIDILLANPLFLSQNEAEKLLLQGFFAENLDKLQLPELEQVLAEKINLKLGLINGKS